MCCGNQDSVEDVMYLFRILRSSGARWNVVAVPKDFAGTASRLSRIDIVERLVALTASSNLLSKN